MDGNVEVFVVLMFAFRKRSMTALLVAARCAVRVVVRIMAFIIPEN
jgi:hypothetical protein